MPFAAKGEEKRGGGGGGQQILAVAERCFQRDSDLSRKIGFVSQDGAANSRRFCFGGFRRRTPWSATVSTMNSTPAALSFIRLAQVPLDQRFHEAFPLSSVSDRRCVAVQDVGNCHKHSFRIS